MLVLPTLIYQRLYYEKRNLERRNIARCRMAYFIPYKEYSSIQEHDNEENSNEAKKSLYEPGIHTQRLVLF
jgi:hypothetical protein